MVLIRLEHHEHPAPPQHEMRQKTVLDSGGEIVGTVTNLYVDEDSRQLRASWTSSRTINTISSWAWKRSTIWSLWKP